MPAFVVGKVRTYSLRHGKDETAVVHVQPKATTHKLIFGIACERAVRLATKVGLIEAGHRITFRGEAYSFALTQF